MLRDTISVSGQCYSSRFGERPLTCNTWPVSLSTALPAYWIFSAFTVFMCNVNVLLELCSYSACSLSIIISIETILFPVAMNTSPSRRPYFRHSFVNLLSPALYNLHMGVSVTCGVFVTSFSFLHLQTFLDIAVSVSFSSLMILLWAQAIFLNSVFFCYIMLWCLHFFCPTKKINSKLVLT